MAANERYIEEIALEQLLSNEEERNLAERIKVGDAKALEKLTKANLKFVVSLAHQYRNHGLDEDDLISEGNIGMMHAARKYDGSKGTRFVIFAAPYIRRAMEEAISEQTALYKVPQKEATPSERKRSHPISMDQPVPVGSSNNFTLQSVIENNNSPRADESLNRQILNSELRQGMNVLNERERKVINLLYGLNGEHYTMAEAGEMTGLKRERVRQVRDKAIRKLKKRLR